MCPDFPVNLGDLGYPVLLEYLVFPVYPDYLEYPENQLFLDDLEYLVHLVYPEYLEYPVVLESLVFLVVLGVLEYLGDLVMLHLQ